MGDREVERRVRQWRRARGVLDAERRRRLADLSDADARREAEDLLALVGVAPPKTGTSGLVEQQRIFARVTE